MARISKSQLKKLQKKYHTDQAIAGLYGLSRQAINQLRKRYGISRVVKRNKLRNETIINEHMAGATALHLSKNYQLSVTHIYRIVKGS